MGFSYDIQIGNGLKRSSISGEDLKKLLREEYPNSVAIYTDGSSNPLLSIACAGFYITQMNVRFGCSLPGSVSSLAAEIYAAYLVIKFAIDEAMEDIIILTDSRGVFNALVNRSLAAHKESKLPHKIAQLVALISGNPESHRHLGECVRRSCR